MRWTGLSPAIRVGMCSSRPRQAWERRRLWRYLNFRRRRGAVMPEFAASQHDRQGATAARRPPVSLGPGRTLDGNVRSGMGARFGHGFSRVRVHSDEKSATFVLRGAVLAVGAPGGLSEREADRTAVAAGGLAVGEPRETPPPATVGAQLARFG